MLGEYEEKATKKTNLYSIIVPVYNSDKYLEMCISSILDQTITNFEIILIDDGSTDASARICDDFAKRDNRIKVIHKHNSGVSDSRNIGIKNAIGDYIGFIDSDDTVLPNLLSKVDSRLKEEKFDIIQFGFNKIVLHPDQSSFVIKDTCSENKLYKSKNLIEESIMLFPNMQIAPVCNKFYRKEIIKNFSFVELGTGEDFLFNINILPSVNSFCVINDCLYNYYIRENEESRSSNYRKSFFEDLDLVYRNMYKLYFEIWKVNNRLKYKRIIDTLMYGMYLNNLECLDHKSFRYYMKHSYAKRAIKNSESFSLREMIYKRILLLKASI